MDNVCIYCLFSFYLESFNTTFTESTDCSRKKSAPASILHIILSYDHIIGGAAALAYTKSTNRHNIFNRFVESKQFEAGDEFNVYDKKKNA